MPEGRDPLGWLLIVSSALHAVLFAGQAVVPPRVTVDPGVISIELAALEPPRNETVRLDIPEERPMDREERIAPVPVPKAEQPPMLEQAEPFQGATVEAQPMEQSNPPPIYPFLARRHGWEGLVRLRVHVSAEGQPQSIDIVRSSGYSVLDQAAVSAVWRWCFVPASRGDRSVDSWVEVPVIFRLKEF